MGLAMGCVGMCLNDFCRLTPSEFTAVFEAWQQKETYAERRGWEQARFLACSILKPYSKRSLELTDVCRFSWDMKPAKEAEEEPSTQERFDEIKALWIEVFLFLFQFVDEFINVLFGDGAVIFLKESVQTDNDE